MEMTAALTVPSIAAVKTSPAIMALRKINEALQQKVVSPSVDLAQGTPPPPNHEVIQESTKKAEALKERLLELLKQNKLADLRSLILEIEQARLCKEALEISRIGAVVNTLRKSVAESSPELAKQCRQLIKSWRSNVTEASRPASSCGSSTSGTPGLVSPAIRRGVTPRGKQITPSQTAHPIDNQTVPANYAPAKQPSPSAALKRKASTSPVEAKKPRLEKQSSVIAARQNVQSTEQLVASLGMEGILDSFARKEPVPTVFKPAPLSAVSADPLQEKKSKRGRKPKNQQQIAQAPLKLKIKFGGQPASASSSEENNTPPQSSSSSVNGSPAVETIDRMEIDLAPEPIPPVRPVITKPKMSWYDKLVSVEELERRAEELKKTEELNKEKLNLAVTAPTFLKHNKRQVLIMPYIELDEPEVDIFNGLLNNDLFAIN